MPTNSIGLVYGHSWRGSHLADSTLLNARQLRWATLNGFATLVWPTGHRWLNVVSGNKGFFANYPQLLKSGNPNNASPKYALDVILPATADYDRLVQINAAHLLRDGLNEWKRTHFDPADGDNNTSDQVLFFSKHVADLMAIGTPAISWPEVTLAGITYPAGSIPAQTGVPGCQIGVYAYAGHRLPPTMDCKPGVYTMIALAFSTAGFGSYEELVAAHGANVAAVLLREYWDTETWSHSLPLLNPRMQRGYFDWYDSFHASGAIGMHTEYAANWFANLVGMRYGMQKCKTGTGTYDDALDDIMAHLFSPGGVEDAGARALFDYWGNSSNHYNTLTLRISCDKIAAMAGSPIKTLLEQWMVICKKRLYLPAQTPKASNPNFPDPLPGDPYPAAYSDYMADVVGVRLDEVIHSYAMMRQDANTFIKTNYPKLGFDYLPEPDWFANPTTPTHAEFTAAHAQLIADTPHDTDLDSDDLVLVRGVQTVLFPTIYPEAAYFAGRNAAPFVFIGPGKVIQSELIGGVVADASEIINVSYGPGAHYFVTEFAFWIITNEGGELFMDTLGGVWKDAHIGPSGNYPPHWLYVPQKAATDGTVTMEVVSRWSFLDRNDAGAVYRLDLYYKTHAAYVPPTDLGPGQVYVDNINTGGNINNTGANRWLSKKPDVIILPKPFADEDFPKMAHVVVSP
jgi:hypothetical protein